MSTLRALATGLSAGLLALVLALAVVVIGIPKATGATALTVRTGSMEPRLPPGTLLVVRPEPASSIKIGDVVTYEPNPDDAATVVSHRVIAIGTSTAGQRVFTVKGDANNAADPPVQAKQIVAVLWYSVPLLGWVNAWVSTVGRGWLLPAVALVLFCYAAWNFVGGFLDHRRRRVRRAR